MGADVEGEGVFGDVLIVGAAGDDEDREAEENALAAAAVGDGGVVRGRSGHGGDGLGDSVGEEGVKVKRRKVLMCTGGKEASIAADFQKITKGIR